MTEIELFAIELLEKLNMANILYLKWNDNE